MGQNRRTATRHEVDLAGTLLEGETSSEIRVLNLSLGGAFLALKRVMGDRIKFSFRIPTLEQPITTEGTVRWVDGKGIGVQFDGLRAQDVWGLGKYFEQLA
ncbi:MAG: PilZ domain-containing protein [Kofleriaceae bacterium]|nr:PilZ domain-containing protein [Kofleriaceae bacterium]MBP6839890.1 PilZ domain-containing protein [Kofleriaceae bacterium]MBP9204710.1 PilZ domain-containing protein [Kofleriaceae bacterium]